MNASGTATVSNSTFTNNVAQSNLFHTSNGGAIDNESGTLTVSNSTFTGNFAFNLGGGIENSFGTATVTGSTLTAMTEKRTAAGSTTTAR